MQEQKSTYPRVLSAASLVCAGWWLLIAGAVCAQQAGATAQGLPSSSQVVVEAGDLRLVLEKAQQGLRVLSLADTAGGQELLAGDSPALFSATLREAKTKELLTITADSGWQEVDVSERLDVHAVCSGLQQDESNRPLRRRA